MPSFRFEVLPNSSQEPATLDAVSFLVREVGLKYSQDRTVTASRIKEELDLARLGGYVYYGLFGHQADLVAAACVGHNIYGETNVWDIAVRPDQREHGVGRQMMRHVAIKAIEHEDTLLATNPHKDVRGFYYKLGFKAVDKLHMVAPPHSVLVANS